MVKKFLANKSAELLLAAQVIDSGESARTKRSSQRPPKTSNPPKKDQSSAPKKKTSDKSRKMDAAKLAVKQREKNRRLARKKLRRSNLNALNPEKSSSGGNGEESHERYLEDTQPALDRRAKRVSFA